MGRKLVIDEDELMSLLKERLGDAEARAIVEKAELRDLSKKIQEKIERIEAILSSL
ncbi:MAG: hypothetical protein ACP5GH_07310 [Nitrososphaeria archaeon]